MMLRVLFGLLVFAVSQSQAEVVVSWGPSSDARTIGYHVEVRGTDNTVLAVEDSSNLTYFFFSDLSSGTSYRFRARAYGAGGLLSAWTETVQYTLSSNPINENVDSDGDGLTDKEELALNTNPYKADSDYDGIQDGQEVIDGSDPLDRGSSLVQIGNVSCVEWNGYLGGMANIVEHTNLGSSPLTVSLELLNKAGDLKSAVGFMLPPGRQQDIIVNGMEGFTENQIGQACIRHDGQPGDLDGRMMYYRETDIKGGRKAQYDFAVSMPFVPGTLGTVHVPFNTFQPSLNMLDQDNPVMNWVQITNLEDTAQTGVVSLFDASGEELFSDTIQLSARERRDFTPNIIGKRAYGTVEWRPSDTTAKFQVRNVRYIYDNVQLLNSFSTAFQHEAVAPTGRKITAGFDGTESSIILELSNTRPADTNVDVKFYGEGGELLAAYYLPLTSMGSFHLIADAFTSGRIGSVVVDGEDRESIIANVMHYQHWGDGHVKRMYGLIAKESLRSVVSGSYNTFIGHDSALLVSNSTDQPLAITMLVKGQSTSGVLAPYGTAMLDPDQGESKNTYGVVTVIAEREKALRSTLFRKAADDYTVPVEMR